jgi:hypothetical protein
MTQRSTIPDLTGISTAHNEPSSDTAGSKLKSEQEAEESKENGAPMTQRDFIPLLESDLALLAIAYDRAELLAWTACMWPWIADDPCASRWAREFMEARAALT